ncbi:uncharacterized protein LOC107646541 [Arachis ipaensis]|uniref:uncharacterized protein LOC107646541 n=1 Tax=Arachis ipaensis TaxID=130454 RepID=UPI0007AEF4D1|nr:uncharacterized protein LOC107646541 [Arachis ipaensis]
MSNVPVSGASGNNSASNSTTSTVTRVENSRPVFSDMSRAMPVNQPSQTVGSLANIRQQMDESHHDLVNMLTHQMVTILNPLLENTNTRIEQLNRQVNRIATVVNLEENDNQGLRFDNVNQNGGAIPNYDVHMPRHGQNADDIAPKGLEIPKSLTKFSREENESTVEHIARYTVEIGEAASNEYLKMRYFPSSLTKNAFTWFSNLRPNSIHSWVQLERNFHDQFFRGELKVSLTDLFSVKRVEGESIDTYLARFRNIRNKCFTPILETEVVKMDTNGLEFGVRKKLVNQHTLDLSQLAERVRQIEQIKKEKENFKKGSKKVAYVDCFSDSSNSDEKEIYIAELRGVLLMYANL